MEFTFAEMSIYLHIAFIFCGKHSTLVHILNVKMEKSRSFTILSLILPKSQLEFYTNDKI